MGRELFPSEWTGEEHTLPIGRAHGASRKAVLTFQVASYAYHSGARHYSHLRGPVLVSSVLADDRVPCAAFVAEPSWNLSSLALRHQVSVLRRSTMADLLGAYASTTGRTGSEHKQSGPRPVHSSVPTAAGPSASGMRPDMLNLEERSDILFCDPCSAPCNSAIPCSYYQFSVPC
jgi:hypothetical protein